MTASTTGSATGSAILLAFALALDLALGLGSRASGGVALFCTSGEDGSGVIGFDHRNIQWPQEISHFLDSFNMVLLVPLCFLVALALVVGMTASSSSGVSLWTVLFFLWCINW